MSIILNILNNSWVISIVTGILVYLLTNWLNKFKENKEYRKNINQVTKDVVIMLQEFIVENKLPEKEMLFSYYKATCEKYHVVTRDAENLGDILDLLTKEILDSKFLNSKNKLEYCKCIMTYKFNLVEEDVSSELSEIEEKLLLKKEENNIKMRRQFALIVSILMGYIALVMSLYMESDSAFNFLKPFNYVLVILVVLLVVLVLIMYLMAAFINRQKKNN